MKGKVFFSKFDNDKINAGGWNCPEGELYLTLTKPLNGKCVDAVDDCLAKGKFVFEGEINNCSEPDMAFGLVQNIDEYHESPFGGRSMMVGDVVIIEFDGWCCESIGWSKLSPEQVAKFLHLK